MTLASNKTPTPSTTLTKHVLAFHRVVPPAANMEGTSDEKTVALLLNTAKLLTDVATELKDELKSHTTELKKLRHQNKAAARDANRKPDPHPLPSQLQSFAFLYSTDIKQVLACCSRSGQTDTITRLPYF
jgi:hypothetical protein